MTKPTFELSGFDKLLKAGWKTSEGQLSTIVAVVGHALAALVTIGIVTQVGADNIVNSLQGALTAGVAFAGAVAVLWRSLSPLLEYVKGRTLLKQQVNSIVHEAIRNDRS